MNTTLSDFEWVEEVPLSNFSNKALIIASRFARALKRVNGNQIVLQDKNLAKKIRHEVVDTNDPKLRLLFDELVTELTTFADTRKQLKDRGSVQKTSVDKQTVDRNYEKSKTVMYRGVEVQAQKNSENINKKSYYRGIEVEG